MGLSEAEIGSGVIARASGAAKDARAAGRWDAMRAAARLGLRQQGVRWRTRTHLALLLVQAAAGRALAGRG
jgi:ethanolamine ammonia-lyase small subunit